MKRCTTSAVMLEQIPEVMEAYLVSGDYDYYISHRRVKDTRDYERRSCVRAPVPGFRAFPPQQIELRAAQHVEGKPDPVVGGVLCRGSLD